MIPFLDKDTPFPDSALADPNGLLAAGGDLSISRLKQAYSQGIFPWYSPGEPILWWSPNPRTVFLLDNYNPPKSLCRFLKKACLRVTLNQAFDRVIKECAMPRDKQTTTWITSEMLDAYSELHRQNLAHSIEVWEKNNLVGGIYGVSIGKLFCGESMFSRISNGSKVALSALVGLLRRENFPLIDCQVENPHLFKLGAINIPRQEYQSIVNVAIQKDISAEFWLCKDLNVDELVVRNQNDQ